MKKVFIIYFTGQVFPIFHSWKLVYELTLLIKVKENVLVIHFSPLHLFFFYSLSMKFHVMSMSTKAKLETEYPVKKKLSNWDYHWHYVFVKASVEPFHMPYSSKWWRKKQECYSDLSGFVHLVLALTLQKFQQNETNMNWKYFEKQIFMHRGRFVAWLFNVSWNPLWTVSIIKNKKQHRNPGNQPAWVWDIKMNIRERFVTQEV